MTIPFLDLGSTRPESIAPLVVAFQRVLASGNFILGRELDAFESAFAKACSSKKCVGVGNGLEAIRLTLQAWNIGPGDEVIVPSHTFIATWLAVAAVGATPVPVEPTPGQFTIDPDAIEQAITRRTRALIPVHLYGHPADMDPIMATAAANDVRVMEDAAQAHGAQYKGRPAGSLGDAAAWSFYPAKNLGALGDAGAITTNDSELAARLRILRNYGSERKYEHLEKATNSRLDELQAAFLSAKLTSLDAWNARRSQIAKRYQEAFSDLPVEVPQVASWANSSWHLFVIQHDARDDFRQRLRLAGIDTQVHYPVPPHLQPAFSDMACPRGTFPQAERLAGRVLSLPMGPFMDDHQVESVIEAVRRCA